MLFVISHVMTAINSKNLAISIKGDRARALAERVRVRQLGLGWRPVGQPARQLGGLTLLDGGHDVAGADALAHLDLDLDVDQQAVPDCFKDLAQQWNALARESRAKPAPRIQSL